MSPSLEKKLRELADGRNETIAVVDGVVIPSPKCALARATLSLAFYVPWAEHDVQEIFHTLATRLGIGEREGGH